MRLHFIANCKSSTLKDCFVSLLRIICLSFSTLCYVSAISFSATNGLTFMAI